MIAANLFGYQKQLQLILEAKHPKQNLDRHARKFRRYITSLDVRYGLLTNGNLLRIYEQVDSGFKLLLQVPGYELSNRSNEISLAKLAISTPFCTSNSVTEIAPTYNRKCCFRVAILRG